VDIFDTGFSTARDGTGFGLVIARPSCDARDWDIDVTESQPGGARFEITGTDSLYS